MAEEKKSKEKTVSEKLRERSRQISESLGKEGALEGLGLSEKKAVKAGKKPSKEEVKERPAKEKAKAPGEGEKKPAVKAGPVKPPEKIVKEPAKEEPVILYPFQEGVKKARELSRKRKFSQTWDLAVSVKGINLKRPENRFSLEYQLPSGRGKGVKVGVFADLLAPEAKKQDADAVISKQEMPRLAKDKKSLKKLAREMEWFFGEVSLMPEIGKSFGMVLGPRGKMPKPIPPNANVGAVLKKARESARLVLKESPVLHVPVGTEEMGDEAVIKNLEGVYAFVKEKLPKGLNSIRNMHLKLTMGKPVRLEVK